VRKSFILIETIDFKNFRSCYDHKRRKIAELDESKKKVCIECGNLKIIVAKRICQ
jgi:hypothetical protein